MRVLGAVLAIIGGVWTAGGAALVIMAVVSAVGHTSGPAAGEYIGAVVMMVMLAAPGAGLFAFALYLLRRYRGSDQPPTDAQPEPQASAAVEAPAASPQANALQLETVVLGLLGFVVFYAVGWMGTCTLGPMLVRSLTGHFPRHGAGVWATPIGLLLGSLGLVLGMVAAGRRRR